MSSNPLRVCIIDSNFNIHFFNKLASKDNFPELAKGQKCYRAFANCDHPCKDCPVIHGFKGPKTFEFGGEKYALINKMDFESEVGLRHALMFKQVEKTDVYEKRMLANGDSMRQLAVIQALASNYANVFGLNLRSGEATLYRFAQLVRGEIKDQVLNGIDASKIIEDYISQNVADEDKDYMRNMLSFEHIIAELKERESYIAHYKIRRDGEVHYWYMRCFRVGNAEDFEEIIVGFANEDDDILWDRQAQYYKFSKSTKRNIIVIDSSVSSIERAKFVLGGFYNVIGFKNDKDAGIFLREHFREISLIMISLDSRDIDTARILEYLSNDAFFGHIPVIIASENYSETLEEQFVKLGALAYVKKPYNATILQKRVENVISYSESKATLNTVEIDSLTGLYTRRAFFRHANTLIQNHPDMRFDLIISDIEDFKGINERYGIRIADSVIRHVARHVLAADNARIICGRYGGDQIAVIMPHDHDANTASFETFKKNVYLDPPISDLKLKFGYYRAIERDVPIATICDRAIVALRSVKHQYGEEMGFYDQRMRRKLSWEKVIEDSMEKAIEENQLKVYYQPKHDAKTGALVGAEALVRWIHPEYGYISPSEFIPVFEKNGFIVKLDLYVWRKVCKDLREWLDKGFHVVPISINASRRDFIKAQDMDYVLDSIKEYQLIPNLLHIELTETMYTADASLIAPKVKNLRKAGFRIEMDDFGAGYSSLSILSELPLDALKLDMNFVRNLKQKKNIVKTIIFLAKSLKLKTIAEGVETEEQKKLLTDMGVDYIQGYYFSRALTKENFEDYLIEYMPRK